MTVVPSDNVILDQFRVIFNKSGILENCGALLISSDTATLLKKIVGCSLEHICQMSLSPRCFSWRRNLYNSATGWLNSN